MASLDHIQQELLTQLKRAGDRRAVHILINAGELAKAVARLPSGKDLQYCNDVMREEVKAGDEVVRNQRGKM